MTEIYRTRISEVKGLLDSGKASSVLNNNGFIASYSVAEFKKFYRIVVNFDNGDLERVRVYK